MESLVLLDDLGLSSGFGSESRVIGRNKPDDHFRGVGAFFRSCGGGALDIDFGSNGFLRSGKERREQNSRGQNGGDERARMRGQTRH